MKHLKTYENLNEPQKGDYVVVNLKRKSAISNILEKLIGQIIKIGNGTYDIKFGTTNWWIKKDEIIDFSPNKKDLEHYIKANNYNL